MSTTSYFAAYITLAFGASEYGERRVKRDKTIKRYKKETTCQLNPTVRLFSHHITGEQVVSTALHAHHKPVRTYCTM